MHKPNGILEQDVQDELEWDPAIDARRILVKADHGKVTLTGSVPTYQQSVLAKRDTSRIGGVTSVDNQLMVGPAGEAIDDAIVAKKCAAALEKDDMIPYGSVTATVQDGWVTLRGEVRHHFQSRAAEHAVRRVDGVLGVTDDILLTTQPIPSDVAERINAAFRRNAIIDDSMIKVSSVDHTIFLDGTVGSWLAMEEAEETAWDAPGVNKVVDRLMIVP